jgi:hypothetical protein
MEKALTGLDAGKSQDVTLEDVKLKKGTHTLLAVADTKNTVTESNEDNQKTLEVTCKKRIAREPIQIRSTIMTPIFISRFWIRPGVMSVIAGAALLLGTIASARADEPIVRDHRGGNRLICVETHETCQAAILVAYPRIP